MSKYDKYDKICKRQSLTFYPNPDQKPNDIYKMLWSCANYGKIYKIANEAEKPIKTTPKRAP